MSRIITVTSGKGGVGKTNISVNLALYLASQGYRVCLFDADMGLANIDILLGLYPEHTLEDVLSKEKRLQDIIVKDYSGIDIIPGSSGVKKMADPEPGEIDFLIDELTQLEDYDFFFFDTSAGISKNVISFCMASPEIILLVTPEPTSLTDAYSLLKILTLNGFKNTVMVAINQCSRIQVASNIFTKFKNVVHKYLSIDIFPIGTIPSDSHVSEAVKEQKPFISLFPDAGISKGIKNIARHLISKDMEDMGESNLKAFWPRCFDLLESPLRLTGKEMKDGTPVSEENGSTGQEKRPQDPEEDIPVSKDIVDNKIPKGQDDRLPSFAKAPDSNQGIISEEGTLQSSVGSEVEYASDGSAPKHATKPPAPAGGASQDMTPQPMSQDVQILLQGIVNGITSISSELGAIRKIIETDNPFHGKKHTFSNEMESVT